MREEAFHEAQVLGRLRGLETEEAAAYGRRLRGLEAEEAQARDALWREEAFDILVPSTLHHLVILCTCTHLHFHFIPLP